MTKAKAKRTVKITRKKYVFPAKRKRVRVYNGDMLFIEIFNNMYERLRIEVE